MNDERETLIGALDQGTSSCRFIIFNTTGKPIQTTFEEIQSTHPSPGWYEQDAEQIYELSLKCIKTGLQKLKTIGKMNKLKCFGISNQRESIIFWSKKTGKAISPAIIWCDNRTNNLVNRFKAEYDRRKYSELNGIPISSYFSALKIRWGVDNVLTISQALQNEELLVGTIDSWLLYKFSILNSLEDSIHITDVSNASRTMLMDLVELEWSKELCLFFEIPMNILPKIVSSSEIYLKLRIQPNGDIKFAKGNIKEYEFDIPISGCLGDQQAALIGQSCIYPGTAKNTYGTGCFMLFNVGTIPLVSKFGLISTVAYKFNSTTVYALEGSIATAASAINWLRDGLDLIRTPEECSELASQVNDSGGVFFVTGFSGLYAPYWDPNATGCLIGITRYTNKNHIARATLESVCFQTKAILDSMDLDSGIQLKYLNVDGGLSNSDCCMQIQADLLGIPVIRPKDIEASALGVAIASALGVGIFETLEEAIDNVLVSSENNSTKFESKLDENVREIRFDEWNKAVERSLNWNRN